MSHQFTLFDTPMDGRNIPMSMEELEDFRNMEEFEIDYLPEFFRSYSEEITFEPLEREGEETIHEEYVSEPPHEPYSLIYNPANTYEDILIDEQVSPELIHFFEGVVYEDLGDFLRSFELGDTWLTNPVFSDQFAVFYLPRRLYRIVIELHNILHIRTIVPGRTRDLRYSSLSESQQTQLRELIHANPTKYNQLDNVYNILKGFRSRTESYQIKFLLNLTLDVVIDVLRKPTNE